MDSANSSNSPLKTSRTPRRSRRRVAGDSKPRRRKPPCCAPPALRRPPLHHIPTNSRILHPEFSLLFPREPQFQLSGFDLNKLAMGVYEIEAYGRIGLKRMAHEVLGKVMEKPYHVTMSDWDSEELVYEQVEYACIDAFMSFELWDEVVL
ncbi:hypothetical protein MTR67_036991 [Solanum verrucosum]|uniref:3'-5' exonuclease domain-containing protein n=1 Tax=Solanum verrucosum TaxID=315347 RepID=A0AAF0ZLH5_SOLVR|nr:hypothetical protein MTR67_036991 [Solanum verrucosum]